MSDQREYDEGADSGHQQPVATPDTRDTDQGPGGIPDRRPPFDFGVPRAIFEVLRSLGAEGRRLLAVLSSQSNIVMLDPQDRYPVDRSGPGAVAIGRDPQTGEFRIVAVDRGMDPNAHRSSPVTGDVMIHPSVCYADILKYPTITQSWDADGPCTLYSDTLDDAQQAVTFIPKRRIDLYGHLASDSNQITNDLKTAFDQNHDIQGNTVDRDINQFFSTSIGSPFPWHPNGPVTQKTVRSLFRRRRYMLGYIEDVTTQMSQADLVTRNEDVVRSYKTMNIGSEGSRLFQHWRSYNITPRYFHLQLRHVLSCLPGSRLFGIYSGATHDVYGPGIFNTEGVAKVTSLPQPADPPSRSYVCCTSGHGFLCTGFMDGKTRYWNYHEHGDSLNVHYGFDIDVCVGDHIANFVEIHNAPGTPHSLVSCNDSFIYEFDLSRGNNRNVPNWDIGFPEPVNHATLHPDGSILCCSTDSRDVTLVDRNSLRPVAALKGHLDFGFTASWHPAGRLLATGNQDSTCRIWDIRKFDKSLLVLPGHVTSVRQCLFSPNGKYLVHAEADDYIDVYDVHSGFKRFQPIDYFGSFGGLTFSNTGTELFLGVVDSRYGSVLEFRKLL